MAHFVLTDARVDIAGNTLSSDVDNVSVDHRAELQDNTTMTTAGGTSWRKRLGGLHDYTMTITFKQDVSAALLDSILNPLVGATGTSVHVYSNSTAASDWVHYSGTPILETYNIFGNAVGETAGATATFQGDGTLTRSTTT